MKTQNVQDYLLAHGIRKTSFRIDLLTLFMESKHSLSFKDIEESVNSTQDRTTIYRAITAFLEKGLIHKVPNADNVSRYALCLQEPHEHNHAHFICYKCKQTFCMHEVKIPVCKNIDGFEVITSNVTFEGYCSNCASGSNQ